MMEYIYLVIKVKGIETMISHVREAYQSLKSHSAFLKSLTKPKNELRILDAPSCINQINSSNTFSQGSLDKIANLSR